ncbi:MAG: hypothetical protein AAF399_07035, partial [Bacteroidota bacterium]
EKMLTIIGPGYFSGENPGSNSQEAIIRNIILERTSGAGPNTGAAGSTIMGISFTELSSSGIGVNVSNVTVKRNLFRGDISIVGFDISNVIVMANFFQRIPVGFLSSNPGFNNFTFTNNICGEDFRFPDNSSGMVEHNLFLDDSFTLIGFVGTVRSNIFASIATSNFTLVTSPGNSTHNTGGNGQFGNTNNNNTVPVNTMFVGPGSTDGQYFPASPVLLNTAHDGTNRGPFGGICTYNLSGLGGVPYIEMLSVPPVGTFGNPFIITVKAVSRP